MIPSGGLAVRSVPKRIGAIPAQLHPLNALVRWFDPRLDLLTRHGRSRAPWLSAPRTSILSPTGLHGVMRNSARDQFLACHRERRTDACDRSRKVLRLG